MNKQQKNLSIPPYLSTSWENVQSLHYESGSLIVTLKNEKQIPIPNLSSEEINNLFTLHSDHLNSSEEPKLMPAPDPSKPKLTPPLPPFLNPGSGSGLSLGISTLDGMSSMMEHNPSQSHMPDLPKEILEKVAAVAKIVSPAELNLIPKAEPHCNCMHCQISRKIHEKLGQEEETTTTEEEEEILEEDLKFREWDITQLDEKLYSVANPLDPNEKYQVFLGDPVGCTCGKPNCEHIVAVLKS